MALARKYPNADHEWPWQWVFPATRFYVERATGRPHHLIRTVQELLDHRDVTITMIYTHVLDRGPAGVQSPADRMTTL